MIQADEVKAKIIENQKAEEKALVIAVGKRWIEIVDEMEEDIEKAMINPKDFVIFTSYNLLLSMDKHEIIPGSILSKYRNQHDTDVTGLFCSFIPKFTGLRNKLITNGYKFEIICEGWGTGGRHNTITARVSIPDRKPDIPEVIPPVIEKVVENEEKIVVSLWNRVLQKLNLK